MGGMTIMALADRYPEMFGDRIQGVALIATSVGKLAELTLGLPALVSKVVHKVAPTTVSLLGLQARWSTAPATWAATSPS